MKFLVLIGAAVMVGDPGFAAVIAGGFAMLNSYLLWKLREPVLATHRAILSPRRIIYDSEGNPIGTVLDLRGDPNFSVSQLLESQRRHTDDAE